jgi:predicted nucleic acid-binding protein
VIYAVDSTVLSDLFRSDAVFGPLSLELLSACRLEGSIVACEVVWAEVGSLFPSPRSAQGALDQAQIEFNAMTAEAALRASSVFKSYHQRGGSRQRMIADFLIGAHALTQADCLLTRDRGFYRTYFTQLRILDPTDRHQT